MQDRVGRVGALLFVVADGLFWATLFYLAVYHRLYEHDTRIEEYVGRTTAWPDVPAAQQLSMAGVGAVVGLGWLAVVLDFARRHAFAAVAALAACLGMVGLLAWASGHGLPLNRGRYGLYAHGLGVVLTVHLAAAFAVLFLRARSKKSADDAPATLGRLSPFVVLVALAATAYALVLL